MTTAFVTVRIASSRLPRKCCLPFGDMTVLEHVIKRALHFGLQPIVCTTNHIDDDEVVNIAKKLHVRYFRGPSANKLMRWRDCCSEFSVAAFHTLDADDPFFDPSQINESMNLLARGYDVVEPTLHSSQGYASVGYSLTCDIVERACKKLTANTDTEMMWHYLSKVPHVKKIRLPDSHNDSAEQVRLTLDYEEDYWLLRTVQRILGHYATREQIDNLFRQNPDLHRINWFRNSEWKMNQDAKALA